MSTSGNLQRQVQAAINDLVASRDEIGLQVAVVHEGRVVVDAVAGVADQRTGEPVTRGTLFFAASTGKGVASSVVHVLVERGDLADSGVAIAVMRNRVLGGFFAVSAIDDLVAGGSPTPPS